MLSHKTIARFSRRKNKHSIPPYIKPSKLSIYEKWSLFFSLLALGISLITSIFFSSVRQELFYVGRLTANYGFSVGTLDIWIKNTGYKPISNISVNLASKCEGVTLTTDYEKITVTPISPVELQTYGKLISVKSHITLARNDQISWQVPMQIPKDASPDGLKYCVDISIFSDVGFAEPLITIIQYRSGDGF
jgi:hypothetical protein